MTSTHTAFALTGEFATSITHDLGGPNGSPRELDEPVPVYQGGVIAMPPDGRSYDVGAELEKGDGIIVVSTANVPLVEVLRGYAPLAEVAVPDDWAGEDDLDQMTVPMLQDLARSLDVSPAGRKPELVTRIKVARSNLAAGRPADHAPQTTGEPTTENPSQED